MIPTFVPFSSKEPDDILDYVLSLKHFSLSLSTVVTSLKKFQVPKTEELFKETNNSQQYINFSVHTMQMLVCLYLPSRTRFTLRKANELFSLHILFNSGQCLVPQTSLYFVDTPALVPVTLPIPCS